MRKRFYFTTGTSCPAQPIVMKIFGGWDCIGEQNFYNPPSFVTDSYKLKLGRDMNMITTRLLWLSICLTVLAGLPAASAQTGPKAATPAPSAAVVDIDLATAYSADN